MATEVELSEEVASLIRVRNRLSTAPDDKLSKILGALLPKLLVRLNSSLVAESTGTSSDSLQCKKLTLHIQEYINEILCHSLKRLRENQTLPTNNVIAALLPDVLSTSNVVGTWALIFIQEGILRCTFATLPLDTVSTLIQAVDYLHSETSINPTQSLHLRLNNCSWLFFDCMMINADLMPLVDWNIDSFDQEEIRRTSEKSNIMSALPSEKALSAASAHGSGIFHLLLDLLLFWPTDSPQISGISVDAEGLMCHRLPKPIGEQQFGLMQPHRERRFFQRTEWSDMALNYLRHMKHICLRYAIWPIDGGLFQGSNADRALVLAVLFASHDSIHSRLATDYINQVSTVENIARPTKGSFKMSTINYSLQVASALLIMMIGDQRAAPLLQKFEERHQRAPWKPILGIIPTRTERQRAPLPASISFRTTSFLLQHRLSFDATEAAIEDLELFMDMALLLATLPEGDGSFDRVNAKFWASQIIQMVIDQIMPLVKGKEGISFTRPALQVAVEVISVVVDLFNGFVEPSHAGNQQVPMGVDAPSRQRSNLYRTLATHRATQKRRTIGTDDAVRARHIAYKIIQRFASHTISRENYPFELPTLLLRCAIYEDEFMQQDVAQANAALLHVYTGIIQAKQFSWLSAKARTYDTVTSPQHLVVPILPAILDAVCSDSTSARLLAIQWIGKFLYIMDVDAASYLMNFLTNDLNSQVASSATCAMQNFGGLTCTISQENLLVDFVDRSTTTGMQKLQTILRSRVLQVSRQLDISIEKAATLLVDVRFSSRDMADFVRMDPEKMLYESGLSGTCPDPDLADGSVSHTICCGICLEDVTMGEVFALNCSHGFCTECWNNYIEITGQNQKYGYLYLRCPQSNCISRVLPHHIVELVPMGREKWEDSYFNAFLEMDYSCRLCPGTNCDYVAVLNKENDTKLPTTCKCINCNTLFCFDCGKEPHRPATCDAILEWDRIQAQSDFWVRRNAKPCPGCHAPIEKTQGCNHMTCTCGVQFCWVCLSQLRRHSEIHTCNRYDPMNDTEDDYQRRALFVSERYENHLQAEHFAIKQLNAAIERSHRSVEVVWFLSEDDEETLRGALQTLCDARRYLRCSYVASFGLRHDKKLLSILEDYQCALEMLTERLSQLTEMNLQRLYIEKGPHGVKGHFHGLAFYNISVSNYMDRFNTAVLKPRCQMEESRPITL